MDAKSNMKDVVGELRRETFESYTSIRRNVKQWLAEVSRCLKGMFDREATALQQSVCDAIYGAATDM